MKIAGIRHKGLRRFLESGDTSGLLAGRERRIMNVFSAVRAAKNLQALRTFPGLRLHPLKGERKGQWSVTITGNWRLTFREKDGTIFEVDMEDYH